MPFTQLPVWGRDLLARVRVAHLAFLDEDDRPRVLPVTFALAGGAVWSAALCVDRYDDDWSRLAWVQLLGRVDVLEAAAGVPGLDALTAKYPQYREQPPPGPLLRLTVQRALSWSASGA